MALRVLLADESSTIKKVFQLSLQDYAVEVKSVNLGIDVLAVAERFEPDIIFADVLLQKKNGYEVCSELRDTKDFADVPVVLMWSGFMELDQDKFQACGATASLEKPFDVEKLRGIIQELVPKTQTSVISKYLQFPDMPEIEEQKPPATSPQKTKSQESAPAVDATTAEPPELPSADEIEAVDTDVNDSDWNMDNFEAVNLSEHQSSAPVAPAPEPESHTDVLEDSPEDQDWVQSTSDDFKLDIPVDDNASADEIDLDIGQVMPPEPEPEPVAEPLEDSNSEPIYADALTPVPDHPDDPKPAEMPMHEYQSTGPDLIIETLPEEPDSDTVANFEFTDSSAEESFEGTSVSTHAPHIPEISKNPALTEENVERIIRAISTEVIEKVVWKVVPELAAQIIEKELNRLIEEQSENNL